MTDTTVPGGTRNRGNTRARLFDAAIDVFAEVGLEAASVEQIAERAGFTRGAFYSNFESKEAMFLELARTVSAEQLNAVSSAVAEFEKHGIGDLTFPEMIYRLLELATHGRTGILFGDEFRTGALRDESLRGPYLEWRGEMIVQITDIVERIENATGLHIRMSAEELATILLVQCEAAAFTAILEGASDEEIDVRMRAVVVALGEAVIDGGVQAFRSA